MTTAQQLGLVGNSVRVQALPTASAETFGQGNRYYTLIGQQEGYITGHTYHTVVANDVYSWEDVAGGNYNMLDNIPVINQDLTSSGFTPAANTYYRHTGATTSTFTQGVIYLYDTAYHKLGESGGLQKLTYNVETEANAFWNKLKEIFNRIKYITYNAGEVNRLTPVFSNGNAIFSFYGVYSNSKNQTGEIIYTVTGGDVYIVSRWINSSGTITYSNESIKVVNIYYE